MTEFISDAAAATKVQRPLPILYSFRRCPYAMRARMAISYSGLTVELREVVLREMPATLLACSPKGTVPVLVLPDGQVLEESRDIIDRVLADNDPDKWQPDPDDVLSAEIKCLLDQNDASRVRKLFQHPLEQINTPDRCAQIPHVAAKDAVEVV